MKAAVWVEAHKMKIQEIPEPEIKPGEVKIKVTGCGVCGTDVHIFEGAVPLAVPPQVLGHEVCGEVVDFAPDVKGFSIGEKVCVDPVVGCGICSYCHNGKTNLCSSPTIIGYARTGGFSQFTTVPKTHLCKMTPSMTDKEGIIAETLACVINGYDRLNLKAGKSVMILGAGSVGLLWTSLIKSSVVTKIIQTEVVPMRGELAMQLGADFYVDAKKSDFTDAVKTIEPEGVDYVIDTTGNAEAIQQSLHLIKKGGTLMIFGVCPENQRLTVSPYELFAKEISIVGSKMPPQTLDRAVAILNAGIIDCEAIVNASMPLTSLESAIHAFNDKKNKFIKIMINPWIE